MEYSHALRFLCATRTLLVSRRATGSYLAASRFLLTCFFLFLSCCHAQETRKQFTVADEIAIAHFGDPYTGKAEAIQFSPNGDYFAVDTERGRLDLNRPEDSLRFYRSRDIEDFLNKSDKRQMPPPVWSVTLSTSKEGPIIRQWRWLLDSSGVVFLEALEGGNQRLVVADLRKRTVEPLTSATESVGVFDVLDRQHYVYIATNPLTPEELRAKSLTPAVVGTGRSLSELLMLNNATSIRAFSPYGGLWAVLDGQRFKMKENGTPLPTDGSIALSPDSSSLIANVSLPDVPLSWETLYPPSFASSPYRVRSGHQQALSGLVHQYVWINLKTGSMQPLTDAPSSDDVGLWAGGGTSSWSSDGQAALLPGTYVESKDHAPSRPCVAVVDLPSHTTTCVEMLKGRTETGVEEGFHPIKDVRFIDGDKQRVMVRFYDYQGDFSIKATEYGQGVNGTWQVVRQSTGGAAVGRRSFEVIVEQGLNEPPRLVARGQSSHVIWDPNPQLRDIELGQTSIYTWKNKEGQTQRGGLYRPNSYKPGRRYPLVIQTHGFIESEFRPSGIFPTGFAARALAQAGIVVLQVRERACPVVTPDEGLCAVADYEGAVRQLVSDGLVDPEKIGIIGFSRTCFYVMEALTRSSIHFRAASITDGIMETYLQYLTSVDTFGNDLSREFDAMVGAAPFGEGLELWLKHSPTFNLDRVHTPLIVVGEGPLSLLSMWEPYAGLRYLKKPVDLVMLNTNEHVLTNPAVRMASQGSSVDWFRFWLKGEEDPDAGKADQYIRWRELRTLQQ